MQFGIMGMGPVFWQIAVVRFTAYFHPFSPCTGLDSMRKHKIGWCKRGWEKRSELNNDSENLEAAAAAELSNAIHLVTCSAYLHTELV